MSEKASEAKKVIVMSPLADPVVSAMFADKETAGLAIVSLINAVLEEDHSAIKIEKVISVIPQRHHSGLAQRGCRIDIEVATKDSEWVVIEVQMSPETWIMHRNLFAASRIYTETSVPGDTSHAMSVRLPKLIMINIINFLVREDNPDVLQPVKMTFMKKPRRVAVRNLAVYNVQLPKINEMKEDFNNAWYCWFYALYKADREKITLGKVMDMTPQLQAFSKRDAGFRQYCEQYERVSADPEIREEYYNWVDGLMREAGIKHAAEEIVRREVEEKWQGVVAEKDEEWQGVVAEKDAIIAELRAKLGESK